MRTRRRRHGHLERALLSMGCLVLTGTAGVLDLAAAGETAPATPNADTFRREFGESDRAAFLRPPRVFYPEIWFHFIGGNVAEAGITADLEAIAAAGIQGIQLFHGQFGGASPGVEPQIECLSEAWDDAVHHVATECRRLGLRFTLQNCPGWAMAGGPWITPEVAMRHLVWSRTDVKGGTAVTAALPRPRASAGAGLGHEQPRRPAVERVPAREARGADPARADR